MSIVDGVGLITWEGGLFTPDSALLPRVRWAFAQIRAEGGSIVLNEAGRPFGVFSDQYARNVSDTESGLSTVWFQWGRYTRGETPSAGDPRSGNPYASEHTQGIAIDCNANPTSLRAKYFPMVGLSNTISSESWHWAIRGPSQVDVSEYAWAGENFTPIVPEEEDMKAALVTSDGANIYATDGVSKRWVRDGTEIQALFDLNLIQSKDAKSVDKAIIDRIPDLTFVNNAIAANLAKK